jgi:triosephosphate isomerase
MENIDGALVGGASLKFESFIGIIKNVTERKT